MSTTIAAGHEAEKLVEAFKKLPTDQREVFFSAFQRIM